MKLAIQLNANELSINDYSMEISEKYKIKFYH